MKIKAIPIKSRTLCLKCRFCGLNECFGMKCEHCEIGKFKIDGDCYCDTINIGERCIHFEAWNRRDGDV